MLSEDKKTVYTADEIPLVSEIDFKNKLLLTGGKDRRVIVYTSLNDFKMTKG